MDPEDPTSPKCEQERQCEACEARAVLEWSNFFGLSGKTGDAAKNQLQQFRPVSQEQPCQKR